MRRSQSPASSCCTASGRDSSDWDVWAFKVELRLQSGTRCLGPEVCTAKQGLLAPAGYLHQSLSARAFVFDPKSLDSFEFAAIPSLNKTLVLELARCEYVACRENVIAVGNS